LSTVLDEYIIDKDYLDALINSVVTSNLIFSSETTNTDDYVVELPVSPGSYTFGLTVNFIASANCTTSPTLNVNSLGVKAIKDNLGNTLVAGAILADQIATVIYDGTSFRLTSSSAAYSGITLNDSIINNPTIVNWYGWNLSEETWTYASATTLYVNADVRGKLSKGDKLKFTQGTVKYFYIVGLSEFTGGYTTITICAGSDYTLANDTISSVYYSKVVNPPGFPEYFNWTPTLTGFSSVPADSYYRFSLDGRECTIYIRQGHDGVSNSTGFTISLPILPAANPDFWGVLCIGTNNSDRMTTPAMVEILAATPALRVCKTTDGGTTSWTASGGKRLNYCKASYYY
jgi:hypothetical protein